MPRTSLISRAQRVCSALVLVAGFGVIAETRDAEAADGTALKVSAHIVGLLKTENAAFQMVPSNRLDTLTAAPQVSLLPKRRLPIKPQKAFKVARTKKIKTT